MKLVGVFVRDMSFYYSTILREIISSTKNTYKAGYKQIDFFIQTNVRQMENIHTHIATNIHRLLNANYSIILSRRAILICMFCSHPQP